MKFVGFIKQNKVAVIIAILLIISVFIYRKQEHFTTSSKYGGDGGKSIFDYKCPAGTKVTGFRGRGGALLNSIGVKCSDGTASTTFGGTGGSDYNIDCLSGYDEVIVNSGDMIDSFTVKCDGDTAKAGGNGGNKLTMTCPSKEQVVGIKGKHGDVVNSLYFYCDYIPDPVDVVSVEGKTVSCDNNATVYKIESGNTRLFPNGIDGDAYKSHGSPTITPISCEDINLLPTGANMTILGGEQNDDEVLPENNKPEQSASAKTHKFINKLNIDVKLKLNGDDYTVNAGETVDVKDVDEFTVVTNGVKAEDITKDSDSLKVFKLIDVEVEVESGLSTGAIVGIVVGIVVSLILIGVAIFFVMKNRKTQTGGSNKMLKEIKKMFGK